VKGLFVFLFGLSLLGWIVGALLSLLNHGTLLAPAGW
jgi:hypothetical protein